MGAHSQTKDRTAVGLDLDAFWDAHPELRPDEEMVIKAMRQMGIAREEGSQTDLFDESST